METTESGSVGSKLRRRGLIAGAAALIAGIAAKQASAPVEASDLHISDFTASASGVVYRITNSGSGGGIEGLGTSEGVGGFASGSGGIGVFGNGPNGTGVWGRSFGTNNTGTYGEAPNGTVAKGVYGRAGNGYGVYGEATGSVGYGVTGVATASYGVFGTSAGSTGVRGAVSGSTANMAGVHGLTFSSGAGGTGVRGTVGSTANSAYGVLGEIVTGSNGANTVGVFGLCLSSQPGNGVYGASATGNGVVGSSGATGYAGIVGSNGGNAAGRAGLFFGNVAIAGSLTVNGTQIASLGGGSAVKHADGTQRLVHAVESPEAWLEDVGKGALTGGMGAVTIDPDFAAVADMSDYLIFLTPKGDTTGLAVAAQSASAFTVRGVGGAGNDEFYWRVMAKRSGGKTQRLAKYAEPTLEARGLVDLPTPPPAPAAPKDAAAPPTPPPNPVPPSRSVPPPAAPSAAATGVPAVAPAANPASVPPATAVPPLPAPPPRP